MATRKPLIVNPDASQIQELPAGDSLNGIANVTATGTAPANVFVGGGIVPLCAILMWSGTGSSTAVPTGFTLCDGNGGTAVNGITIPDLRDKFIVGANAVTGSDSTYPGLSMNQTGGSANAVLPSHTHTQSGGTTDDDGGSHVPGSPNSGSAMSNISNAGIDNTGTLKTDGSVSGTNANLPPFLALAFIIRTS